VGGGCERAEDLDQFRQDNGLALLLGHELPAAQAARDFWRNSTPKTYRCCMKAKRRSLPRQRRCWFGQGQMSNSFSTCNAGRPVKTATLDVDATVIHCDKRVAKRSSDGNRGYQPVLTLWVEQDVIVADEFRDGNVPAGSGNRRVVEKALAALPGRTTQPDGTELVNGCSGANSTVTSGIASGRGADKRRRGRACPGIEGACAATSSATSRRDSIKAGRRTNARVGDDRSEAKASE
jgi:hypothetical protein